MRECEGESEYGYESVGMSEDETVRVKVWVYESEGGSVSVRVWE